MDLLPPPFFSKFFGEILQEPTQLTRKLHMTPESEIKIPEKNADISIA
jgi:hypothetical protein